MFFAYSVLTDKIRLSIYERTQCHIKAKYIIMEANKIISSVMCDNTIPSMPRDPQYAFAYIKFQQYGNLFSPEDVLNCGTYFKDLSMPYTAWRKGEKNGNCK